MGGPCMCGDPYCGRCGTPGLAEAEAAEEWAMERLAKAGLTPDEYRIAVRAGLVAVKQARLACKQQLDEIRFVEAEARAGGVCPGCGSDIEPVL